MDQQNQEQKERDRKSTGQRAHELYKRGRAIQKYAKLARKARYAIQAAQAASAVIASVNPITWMVIGGVIAFIIIIFIIVMITGQKFDGQNPGDPSQIPTTIQGLTLQKTGLAGCITDCTVNNGQDIVYTISGIYSGSNQITVRDPIPTNTVYLSASGTFTQERDASGKTTAVTWNFQPSAGNSKSFFFTLTVHPTQNDIQVINEAVATVGGGSNPPANGTPAPNSTGTPPSPGATDFDSLIKNQGRNVAILGDENTFVQLVKTNGSKWIGTKPNIDSYLRQIYQTAVSKQVNPVIVLVIWGVEATLTLNNTEFGCNPFGSGFNSQLTCAVNSLNNLMGNFEKIYKSGTPVPIAVVDKNLKPTGQYCYYTDAFSYAYEMYTPVCHFSHSNDPTRKNFINFYKGFTGQ